MDRDVSTPPVISRLTYSSRSQIEDGRSHCQRDRYLTYHAGPNGYGLVRKGQSIPLATGSMGHTAMAPIMRWCQDHDGEIQQALALPEAQGPGPSFLVVPREVIRAAIVEGQEEYDRAVVARGFAYAADEPETQYLIKEQKALIAGLVWAWTIEVLPEILRHSRILEVENDQALVYDCTCGLGAFVGTHTDHVERACEGKAFANKPDFITQNRTTEELGYHEFKTSGSDSPTFRDQWEIKMQMITATVDVELRHGKPVVEIWIHGLLKGRREQDYNAVTRRRDAGTYKQSSPACYGYVKPAVPPMEPADIRPGREWWDPFEQRMRAVGKNHQKTPMWEIPLPVPEGWTQEEAWSEFMGAEARRKMLAIVGPLTRQDQMLQGFWEETKAEEDRWIGGLWDLHDLAQQLIAEAADTPGGVPEDYWRTVWADERFQRALNQWFPRSYACRRYGNRYKCQHENTCFYREGWDHPLAASVLDQEGTGMFILRRPHHQQELDQAVARGLLPPDDEGLIDDAEEPGW